MKVTVTRLDNNLMAALLMFTPAPSGLLMFSRSGAAKVRIKVGRLVAADGD